jgi:chromosome partitioning protein
MDAWATQSVCDTALRLKSQVRIVLNRIPPRTSTIEDVLAALGPHASLLLDSCLGNRVAFSSRSSPAAPRPR